MQEHRRHGKDCRPVAAGFQAQHLRRLVEVEQRFGDAPEQYAGGDRRAEGDGEPAPAVEKRLRVRPADGRAAEGRERDGGQKRQEQDRSEEHTSELQSLMRISYAVFCLKKKKKNKKKNAR